jgi:putative nucleotidyltransferase with HDIG domain
MTGEFMTLLQSKERFARYADSEEVMKDLFRLLRKSVGCRWAVIYLLDGDRRNFTPALSAGLPPRYQATFEEMPLSPEKVPLLKKILKEKHYLLLNDSGSSELLSAHLRKLLGSIALLAVPLVARNQVLGVAFVARNRNYPRFTSREIALVRDLVSHAALVLGHIRMFEELLDMSLDMGKRIDVILTLDEINKAISSSLSHDRIIATAMAELERIIQCELMILFREENGALVVVASDSSSLEQVPTFRKGDTPDISGSCVGRTFDRGESCYISSLELGKLSPQFEKKLAGLGVKSLMAIPMLIKEKVQGVLALGDTDPEKFQRDDAFAIEKIAAQMAVALENARLFDEMHSLFINTVASLANAIDAKSAWTKGHSERVMHVAVNIAREMGLDEATLERVRIGGLLHDIGKIGIIEALLEKPERFSDDDFPLMHLHPEKGVAILAPIEQLKDVLPGILHHHERYDGSGYPDHLQGGDIPLEARIIGVADAFDAMLSERPYKKGMPVADTLEELEKCSGTQFDPQMVASLARHVKNSYGKLLPGYSSGGRSDTS